jgi:hypothetical protein
MREAFLEGTVTHWDQEQFPAFFRLAMKLALEVRDSEKAA